ncbi:tumor necrosis factor receptor superfamily member 9-like isoform X2 [Siniperca chuatsi]|uniref:tumor necrosis factor receptor superfamily member 9-like isoform X2 n=1 Tax=Siniperca chuatsi TaxID=119488 RepID=UPI001CE03103|nr:tumor necrosis factor receptor superfamily member 9-like isoform X2 [Siniperca chuatsi]
MAVILWAMGLCLLMQGCLCSVGQTDRGCMKWTQKGDNVCCEACYPGAQVLVQECTATTDTKCGCKEGLTCGDDRCSFCVKKCGKGQEPSAKRSCRPCPEGTFNDQIHQKCKPWSTKCPNPDQKIVAKGDAVTDIKCASINVSLATVSRPKQPDHPEQAWPLVLSVVTSVVLMGFSIIIIITVAMKIHRKRKAENYMEKPCIPKTPIIRTPTDDPMTLIAMECSFHEAQQEQGSSSESLASKDSSDQLLG